MDHGVDIVINGNKISYFAKKPRKSWSRERANYSLPKTLIGKSLRNYYVSKKNLSDKLFSVDDGFEFFVTVRFDFSHYEYMRTYDYEFNGENLIVLPTRAWKDGHKYKDSLMRAFKREFRNSAAIWVVEIGEHHGPLHYHLYVKDSYNLSIHEIKNWFRDKWCKITNQYSDGLVKVATIDIQNGINWYTTQKAKAKYQYPLHLQVPHEETCTNTWDTINSKNLTILKPRVFTVAADVFESAVGALIEEYELYCESSGISVNWDQVERLLISRAHNHICGNDAQLKVFLKKLNKVR